jgi:hypothetical protein
MMNWRGDRPNRKDATPYPNRSEAWTVIRNLVIDRPLAAHTSPRTTRLYDRTNDQITLDEFKKIAI